MDELYEKGINREFIIEKLKERLDRYTERLIIFGMDKKNNKYIFEPLELNPFLYMTLQNMNDESLRKSDPDAFEITEDITEEFRTIRDILLDHKVVIFKEYGIDKGDYVGDPKHDALKINMNIEAVLSAYTSIIWRSVCYPLRFRGNNVYMFFAYKAPLNYHEVELKYITITDFIKQTALLNDFYQKSLERLSKRVNLWRNIGIVTLLILGLIMIRYVSKLLV